MVDKMVFDNMMVVQDNIIVDNCCEIEGKSIVELSTFCLILVVSTTAFLSSLTYISSEGFIKFNIP